MKKLPADTTEEFKARFPKLSAKLESGAFQRLGDGYVEGEDYIGLMSEAEDIERWIDVGTPFISGE